MEKIVNLRTFRKRVARRRDEEQAAANRLLHGAPKAERLLADARRDKASHDLDQHRIPDGEDP